MSAVDNKVFKAVVDILLFVDNIPCFLGASPGVWECFWQGRGCILGILPEGKPNSFRKALGASVHECVVSWQTATWDR